MSESITVQEVVFGQPHLLEAIVSRTIFNGDGSVNIKSFKSLRLVSKHWWSAAITCLYQKDQRPVPLNGNYFEIVVPRVYLEVPSNRINIWNITKPQNRWDEFLQCWQQPNRVDNRKMLPFRVSPTSSYSMDLLERPLTNCGYGLVRIKLEVPHFVDGWQIQDPQLLANLSQLQLVNLRLLEINYKPKSRSFRRREKNVFRWIQQRLLNAHVTSPLRVLLRLNGYPKLFAANLTFPQQTTGLCIELKLGGRDHLETILAKNWNRFVNLEALTVDFSPPKMIPANNLNDFLKTHATSLRRLILVTDPRKDFIQFDQESYFELPVMNKLEFIKVDECWIFDPDKVKPFTAGQSLTPRLKNLFLNSTWPDQLQAWLEQHSSNKLETLWLAIRDDIQNLSPTPHQINCIQAAFPNLTKLDLGLGQPDSLDGLRCVFHRMLQLKNLKIYMITDETRVDLDMLIIGCSAENMAKLREEYALKGTLKSFRESSEIPSLRNLNREY